MKRKGTLILCGLLILCLACGAAGEAAPEDDYSFTDIMALIIDNVEKTARVEELTAQLSELSAQRDALQAEIDGLKQEMRQLTRANAEYQQEIAGLADSARETEALRAQLDRAVTAREQLDLQLETTISLLVTVNDERNQLKLQLESLTAALQDAEDRAAAALAEAAAAQARAPAGGAEDLSDVADGEYLSTRRYIHQLNAHGIRYTYYGADEEDEREEVVSSLRTESDAGDAFTYELSVFFYPDDSQMNVRIWSLIEYEAANLNAVRRVCDALNGSYKWTTFLTDSSDDTVTVSQDVRLLDDPRIGDTMWQTVVTADSILAAAYDYLKAYIKP